MALIAACGDDRTNASDASTAADRRIDSTEPDAGASCVDDDGCGICGIEVAGWSNPLPSGDDLRAVHALPGGGAVAAGGRSVFVSDGSTWTLLPAIDSVVGVNDVWASRPDDVWVATPQGVFRWDGSTWDNVQNSGSSLIHGSADDDVWAIRSSLHWDGSEWTSVGTGVPFPDDVWGSGPADMWVVGRRGGVAHYDGSDWILQVVPSTDDLYVVTGTGPEDIWIGGERGTLLHRTGGTWESVPDLTDRSILQIAAFPDGTVVVLDANRNAFRFDGAEWLEPVALPAAMSIAALADGRLLGVGARGLRAFGDATTLSFEVDAAPLGRNIVGFAEGDALWALASGEGTSRVLRQVAGGWEEALSRESEHGAIAAVGTRAWIVGTSGSIVGWDGAEWSDQDAGGRSDFFFVHAESESDAVAVGPRLISRWDGSSWTPIGQPHVQLEASVATTDGSVIGFQGEQVYVLEDDRFEELLTMNNPVIAVGGVSVNDLFIAVSSGTIDRQLFRRLDERLDRVDGECLLGNVRYIAARSPTDVWFFGSRGARRWDGAETTIAPAFGSTTTAAWFGSDTLWLGTSSEGISRLAVSP